MENKLLNITNDENLTIDSREVAEMLGKEHWEVLRMLQGYIPKGENKSRRIVGIIPTLRNHNVDVSEYFIKDSYKVEGNNKTYDCYLCTKMGCEILGNKLQGEKGILFTAQYVKKFNYMEHSIKEKQIWLFSNKIEELEKTLNKFERLTEEAKEQYKPSHKRKLDYNKMIKSLTNNDEDVQIVKNWVFGLLGISKWEDTCINDSTKIIETITTVSRLLTIKKFEQLSLF
ncbi:Rha family transcriptional regulator [Clostridium botulinum]|uniref:Rha family transcriptional regulator n=2 Tax=Clostridium botulinum TaxID=1491 RepID=UPI0013F9409C|nr:Rha family transcriptional regulator [Clostridium botulinum]MBY6916046.1 Rha family transcriptional regulator [Clostridium botulinum]NFO57717.1 Rha family transcriptional regulator [Clostridium botulinum]NFQ39505.1 Rha family transcriptional regulator [Clostridium botulinum]NFS12791.1 Rha family transcriptional regulator [Clostridium botulinum]